MMTEGARTYSNVANVVRLEIPATLIFPVKQIQKTAQTALHRDESATIVNFSEAAIKAANGHVTAYHEIENTAEAKQPSQELISDKDGRTRIVVTFYGRNGEAVLTIPPKESMSSEFFIEDEDLPLDIAA